MKVDNIIEVGEDFAGFKIDQSPVGKYEGAETEGTARLARAETKVIANTQEYLFNKGKVIQTLDGSISKDIVINSDDKEYVNADNKILNEEREAKREMYFRQARLLYPEKEEWILSMAIDAFMEQEEKGVDITKYEFEKNTEETK
jgi:hypothetical protein